MSSAGVNESLNGRIRHFQRSSVSSNAGSRCIVLLLHIVVGAVRGGTECRLSLAVPDLLVILLRQLLKVALAVIIGVIVISDNIHRFHQFRVIHDLGTAGGNPHLV